MDCSAAGSLGSWGALDGLAHLTGQPHGSTRFSLGRTKKTWYTFANGKRLQSEGEGAFKVNGGGGACACKIDCLNKYPSFSLYRVWRLFLLVQLEKG